jgi:hypothetical protein
MRPLFTENDGVMQEADNAALGYRGAKRVLENNSMIQGTA